MNITKYAQVLSPERWIELTAEAQEKCVTLGDLLTTKETQSNEEVINLRVEFLRWKQANGLLPTQEQFDMLCRMELLSRECGHFLPNR